MSSYVEKYSWIPGGPLYRRFTYAFIHKDLWHLAMNAIVFLLLFSLQGLIIFFISIPLCTLFTRRSVVGASGAIVAMGSFWMIQHHFQYLLIATALYSAIAARFDHRSGIHHLSHFLGAIYGIIFFIFVAWIENSM